MSISVTDIRSNAADQIAHAVQVLGHAKQRITVFRAIYFGKKAAKSVNEIALATGLDRVRVLQEGKRLAANGLVRQIRAAGITSYVKDSFYSANKNRVLQLTQNPVAFAAFPTKARPRNTIPTEITIRIPHQQVRVSFISIDDVDSFSRIRRRKSIPGIYIRIPEAKFKAGIAKILLEKGKFQDWGGERSDLFTTKVRINGKRCPAAFAFKGPGTKGILTPAKMGKHGDQIQRLFRSPAVAFFIQYWGQIDDSINEQMEQFAKARSVTTGLNIFYCVIDGDDSCRLIEAYPNAFKLK